MSIVKTKRRATKFIPPDTVETKVAKSVAEVIASSVKDLPKEEQARRVKLFCDALDDFLRPLASTS